MVWQLDWIEIADFAKRRRRRKEYMILMRDVKRCDYHAVDDGVMSISKLISLVC